MPDWFATTRQWLAGYRRTHGSSPITIVRGLAETVVQATFGVSSHMVESPETGARAAVQSRDFIINTSDYRFSGIQVEPVAGDRVKLGSGPTLIFEAMEFGGDNAWRYTDAYRNSLRLHTKFVDEV